MKIKLYLCFFLASFVVLSCEISPPEEESQDDEETASQEIQVLPGFEAQLLYSVPLDDQGSWVSLALDADGNLLASDQQNKGTYRITVTGDIDDPQVKVEELIMPLSGAQGLLWAFDHLYANVNGKGLFRMRDTEGKGEYDVMEFLGGPVYEGEHGNHTILKTPDGEGFYYVAGNHTPPPEDIAKSRIASWDEDLLLPRKWDARGHARGIMAPGGYIARINPDATEWEMVSIGYRNQYDAVLNEHDELFTYDSDMEWDFGMPWYRPTAIVHVTSGSDYGWRSGSGKWPNYFEDKFPPVLEIGPGSPTGLITGIGAKFPPRYQKALFALDWTFGTIYAIHLRPKGATYEAEAEEFLSGAPLPLTNAVIGKDGAFYFVTGGRNQDSELYRVIYKGDQSTEPAALVDDPEAREAREIRRNLEAFHGVEDNRAISTAWSYLDSNDRVLRYAARVAVEAQPVNSWADKAFEEERPQARITSLVALARMGTPAYRQEVIKSLLDLDIGTLEPDLQLGLLRAMSLTFIRLGSPNEQEITQITNELQNLLPNNDYRVNTEVIRILVYLKDSRVIEKALELMYEETELSVPDWDEALLSRSSRYGGTIEQMIESPPPTEQLHYAFLLRNLEEGWTIEQRRDYFSFINQSADRLGGRSFAGFLEDMRDDALSNSTESEREAVADLTGVSLTQEPDFEITPPEGPGREWTLEEAKETVEGHLNERNFENGRNAFFVTSCSSCHRFDVYGGDIGPDLTNVGRRFNVERLLEKMIDPNIIISDQYSSSRITLEDGRTIIGLVVNRNDSIEIYTRDPDEEPTVVSDNEVVSIEHVDVSQMPPGLINSLNEEELRDLVAYLRSGGDQDHEMFE